MKKTLLAAFLLVCCVLVAAAASAEITVHFDLQGGSPAMEDLHPKAVKDGMVSFQLPDTVPIREGFRFIGWYCLGQEMEYGLWQPGSTVSAPEGNSITCAAQWEASRHQTSCPYLIAWADYPAPADILQVDFKCVQEAPSTYYAVHTWSEADGYAGFQILDDGTHVLILSIWDSGSLNPTVEYAPYSLGSEDFGGEGTGKHVISRYPWTAHRWYTMRIQARTEGGKTVYEQWIRPENGTWQKICAISFPKAHTGFNYCGAFLEDFYPFTNLRRAMQLRNACARLASTGKWVTNKTWHIENYEDNRLIKHNVTYNCKAQPASDSALYMRIGGSGYEPLISFPCTVTLQIAMPFDLRMLE